MKHWSNQNRDQRAATLAELDAQGIGFEEAANILGITKNALHGACFRGNLPRPGGVAPTEWATLGNAEARMARVKELDAAGMSPTQIGRELGTSPGSVITLMHRNKQPLMTSGQMRRPEPVFAVMPDLPPETWLRVHDGPVLADGCQWPIEEDGRHVGFCGAEKAKRNYCSHHHSIAYRGSGVAGPDRPQRAVPLKPISSRSAMKMAGVPARKVERMAE